MKKFLLTLGVASMALTSFAFERILYQQNFENVTDPAEVGWTTSGSLSIASDDNGKFLVFNQGGGSGGRSATLTWGNSIYTDADGNSVVEYGKYTVSFEFCIQQLPNNKFDSDITIFTNHQPIDNNTYRLPWSKTDQVWNNFILDIAEVSRNDGNMQVVVNAPLVDAEDAEEGARQVLDTKNQVNLMPTKWYTATAEVDIETREVEYSVVEFGADRATAEGTWTVPETNPDGSDVSIYAEGITFEIARANGIDYIDNIKITCESSVAIANEPVISLTRIGSTAEGVEDLKVRAYNISFTEGETLHIIGTDASSIEVDWYDCDGIYTYETTTSGILKAWTTIEDAVSETVETEVDCVPVKLPEVIATISSVKNGVGKTYTLTISNSNVPLRPTIFISYEFKGNEGESLKANDMASGAKVSVSQEGTLTLTADAFGYEASTVTVVNNTKFTEKKVWDFAHMSEEELESAGFKSWNVLNSSKTSGFDNWTARKRLYYNNVNDPKLDDDGNPAKDDEGNPLYNAVYPFGFLAEDNTTNVIEYSVIEDNSDNTKYFEGLEIFGTDRHVGMIKRLGIYNDETANNANPVTIKNVSANDFIVVNTIGDYGSNSCHPICATNDEYYAQLTGEDVVLVGKEIVVDEVPSLKKAERNEGSYSIYNAETDTYDVSYALYRIDTALTKISIFSQEGEPTAVEAVEAAVAGDNNWYSIDGVRVAQPTRPGLYIHNGKKVIVK